MFSYPTLKPSEVGPSSLLFIPDTSKTPFIHLYPTDTLPRPSPPVPVPKPGPPGSQYTATLSRTQGPPPPPPAPPLQADGERFRTASQESARIIRERANEDRVPELKTVSLPRDCLPRFLSIAALNTSRNRETCGLLLGKDQKGKYVVTTLLIPKQHSTSDTCTMDEEELVMQFTEERSLITLGWVS
jgi:STAM-binding protein